MRWGLSTTRSLLAGIAISLGAHMFVLSVISQPVGHRAEGAPDGVAAGGRPEPALQARLQMSEASPRSEASALWAPPLASRSVTSQFDLGGLGVMPWSGVGKGQTTPGPVSGGWNAETASLLSRYLAPDLLDVTPVPASAPDYDRLPGANPSGKSMRIRLYVDEAGVVRAVHALKLDQGDAEFMLALREMFLATRYIPGRRNEKAVPSYVDIELDFVAPEDVDTVDPKKLR